MPHEGLEGQGRGEKDGKERGEEGYGEGGREKEGKEAGRGKKGERRVYMYERERRAGKGEGGEEMGDERMGERKW